MDDVIYLTEDFTPVDKDDPRVVMVKVRMPDGRIVFGFPEKPAQQNQLFIHGGPGSGHRGHAGRPGEVGGSTPRGTSSITKGVPGERYTEIAKKFNEMDEDGTQGSSKNKRWRKNHQDDYTNDTQFKAAADYISLYTQGSYDEMKAIAYHRMTGEWPEGIHDWKNSSVPDWEEMDLGITSHPMATYKNYFEGQNLEGKLGISTGDAAMVVEKVIANSPDLDYSLYRGVTGMTLGKRVLPPGVEPGSREAYYKWPPMPEVGQTIDFVGAVSFTRDESIATSFANRTAKGIGNKGLGWGTWATFTYEIEPGAKGIEVSALSPWGQREVLSSGRFEVLSVLESETPSWVARGKNSPPRKVPHYTVKLKQVGVWEID